MYAGLTILGGGILTWIALGFLWVGQAESWTDMPLTALSPKLRDGLNAYALLHHGRLEYYQKYISGSDNSFQAERRRGQYRIGIAHKRRTQWSYWTLKNKILYPESPSAFRINLFLKRHAAKDRQLES